MAPVRNPAAIARVSNLLIHRYRLADRGTSMVCMMGIGSGTVQRIKANLAVPSGLAVYPLDATVLSAV